MSGTEGNDFNSWTSNLNANSIDLWREAMAQLRQLHSDVWNGVRFFLTINGIILASMIALFGLGSSLTIALLVLVLAGVGLFFSWVGIKILGHHRRFYTGMLLRKTLLEKELGFYDVCLHGVDMAFPWSVDGKYVQHLIANADEWQKEQARRRGTISRLLWQSYWLFPAMYAGSLAIVIVGVLSGSFD